ncbi:hypothetical protein ZHAS_00006052 [Anopheles sinensis]|uniref:Uncharacterized protein n=1 Tax=Anopheles sinensis TaxID=74873 RepID=A0A084VL15_ANOSI|nr:hypothetical protein ZHAS_00006052 [Anopheles sinensis]
MHPASNVGSSNGTDDPCYISSNTRMIWESTTRLVKVQNLINELYLSNWSNNELVQVQEPIIGMMRRLLADHEDEALQQTIEDMCLGPQPTGKVKMVAYQCLRALQDQFTNDILFRTEHAKFYDEVEQLMGRLSGESAESTKREIMRHLWVAKTRIAKRSQARYNALQRQQKLSASASTTPPATSSSRSPAPRES